MYDIKFVKFVFEKQLFQYISQDFFLAICFFCVKFKVFFRDEPTSFRIKTNILSKDDSNISKVLLYGDHSFNDKKSTSVLTASIKYIISTKGFDAPLLQN